MWSMRLWAVITPYFLATVLAHGEPAMPAAQVPELPYKLAPTFFVYPHEWTAGEASGVALNSKGHIFLFQRAKPMLSEFDESGHYLRSFNDALFDHPHGLRIDSQDNIWTTDDTNHTVLKLDSAGNVLLVLGRRNNGGEANWLFNKPADVAFDAVGNIYVADGYGNSRIVKFDKNGNFIKAWGTFGSEPGQFILPHTIVIDRSNHVYVGDRENARIQIFDSDGNFIAQWTGIGYPYGLFITPDQHIWMVDGGFDRVVELDQHGKILGAIGSPGHEPGQFAWGHFLAIGADKKMYVADVLNWRFQVFNRTAPSGKLCDYVPTERKFYGFKQSDGYVYRSPGWPIK